jgi:NAD(P)-dependent dehydrogenase (short-subunit alcohol dehydrogenase family)
VYNKMPETLLVTGGSRGIGAATCRRAANAGYAVAVNYRDDFAAAQRVVDDIHAGGGKAISVKADVGNEPDVVAMFEQVTEQLGPLTALVNSAGIGSAHMLVPDFDLNTLQALMQVNVIGTMLCCREAARRMSTALGGSGGAIVNVSSMAGTIGGRPGNSAYAASKAAVDAFSVGFAKEMGPQGVRVNTVRPGVTLTDMTNAVREDEALRKAVEATIAMNRTAQPDEMAAPIMWLLSADASFISGCRLDASGGGFVIGASTSGI